MYSGGVGSWGAARRVADEQGTKDLVLLFSDTLIEDEDLYRFLYESAAHIGGTLVHLKEGRTPWEVFHDARFLGNNRVPLCSRVLKQEPAAKWLKENDPNEQATIVVGIDWTEEHRLPAVVRNYAPRPVRAPLCEEPLIDKADLIAELEAIGIDPPRMYAEGFPHNNCAGFCVRAGQRHFQHLLEKRPGVYAEAESEEQKIRQYLGKDIAILRDRRGGTSRPLTLREFRSGLQSGDKSDGDWGGCGCFVEDEATTSGVHG